MKNIKIPLALITIIALVAFAGNSVLCRLALGENTIDAGSFTVIRLLSGALVLFVISHLRASEKTTTTGGSWPAAIMLFTYAITFSYAYLSLDTGTGALILFGSVQITMIAASIWAGNRLTGLEWIGVILAFLGFVYLVLPNVGSPSFLGFMLMTIAGIAWGFYTLAGKGAVNPLQVTTRNFLLTTPLVIILAGASWQWANYSWQGVILAILSGGLASGVGYSIWYAALGRGLTATRAAVVQLLVPVIAAVGGVVFAGEVLSIRLILSAMIVLGGILLVIVGRQKTTV